MKHPLKWEKLKDRWEEIYPRLKIEVKVRRILPGPILLSSRTGQRKRDESM